MKLIVETTGEFQLYLPGVELHAHAHRPSVVQSCWFFEQHIGAGRLRVLGQVNDDASDDELVKYLAEAEGDQPLAIDSFISTFPFEKEPESEPKPKPKPTPKPKG